MEETGWPKWFSHCRDFLRRIVVYLLQDQPLFETGQWHIDWPKGSTETAGFGFRGGGYYEHHMQYGSFNPHSPVGYRNFAAWPGGARTNAYGSRFARTGK